MLAVTDHLFNSNSAQSLTGFARIVKQYLERPRIRSTDVVYADTIWHTSINSYPITSINSPPQSSGGARHARCHVRRGGHEHEIKSL